MLLKNRAQDAHLAATERLVNGSRGVVVGFVCESLASPDCVAPPFSESDGGRGRVSRSGGRREEEPALGLEHNFFAAFGPH
jgi:hypothetical protein